MEQTAPDRDSRRPVARVLVHSISRDFRPDLVLLYARDANALSGEAAQAIAAMGPIEGRPALYLCENFTLPRAHHFAVGLARLLDGIPEEKLY